MPDSAIYWTSDQPRSGWRVVRSDDGLSWRAEQLAGPRVITDPQLLNVLKALAGEDAALQSRYTETQVRAAAQTAGISDPSALITALRAPPQRTP